MLASVFISQGVKAVTDPSSTSVQAEMLRDRVAPLLRRVAPDPIASRVPDDAAAWSRLRGVAQVLGGVGLSTGLGRRCGALVLAACNLQDLVATGGLGRKAFSDPEVLTKVALTGGVLLAAQDTEGRPGLGYRSRTACARTQAGGRTGRKATRKASRTATRGTHKAGRGTRQDVRSATTETKSGLAS